MLDFATPLEGIRSPFGRRQGGAAFSPTALFALAEPGVWFDPSDTPTLFQDSAGTTPVTTPGNTVGLMLDKSKGLALGAELVANGDFSSGTTGWTAASGAVLSNNAERLQIVASGGAQGTTQAFTTTAGVRYQGTVTVASATATYYIGYGNALGQGQVFASAELTGSRTYTFSFVGNGTSTTFWLYANAPGTFIFDNISVRELAGNHATQATLTARPTYSIEPVGGRRNLLLQTEGFDTASWGKDSCTVPATQYLAPDGTTTADRIVSAAATAQTGVGQSATTQSGAAHTASYYVQANGARYVQLLWGGSTSGNYANFDLQTVTVTGGIYTAATITAAANGFYRITITSTVATTLTGSFLWLVDSGTVVRGGSYTGNGTSGIYVWGAQLELGSTATAYQRVTTQHDVTEAGVASVGYLYFDGTDDAMVTSTITPGIDKVQVFAGVRKVSDAARGVVAELSSVLTNPGAFVIYAPSLTATGNYAWYSNGSATSGVIAPTAYAAPITNVLTGLGDISGDTATLRLDGSQIGTSTADQGTGNYLAYPLYIGARGGTTLEFWGHLYSLITRFGPTLDAPTIASTETYVAGKTGFYTPIITGVPTIGVS